MTNRQSIYYWKCDRPSAFFALDERDEDLESSAIERLLRPVLVDYFRSDAVSLRSGNGQGNHLTYVATVGHTQRFIRLENGPEGDDFMEIEARVLREIKALGIPAPAVFAADATRSVVPFAYQILEYVPYPDLNRLYKEGKLNLPVIAEKIGQYVAKWQTIQFSSFGPFDPAKLRKEDRLLGLHPRYRDYFLLNWEKHLDFLVQKRFLSASESTEIRQLVQKYDAYLEVDEGCLVHKDLALWNMLGVSDEVIAFIDWDDTVSGDATDDLSLLACFHSGEVVMAAMKGYQKVKPLPENFLIRFWLHLLRNMIVKAVIRVGANYFDRQSDFFLIGSGSSGASLKTFTLQRIKTACLGLQNLKHVHDL
ncbi:phosphotransferase family protein [Larkinella rosea]|uniref:Aminoglycoside phosphotransferase family protein n=1 Tax=Larkinella rosea TaxID=2025312 RepID=A0A3P1BNM5_9BACT|nr:aminoglycoside phosphotransferase family protein [Larkinella rosea]RRB02513.1 aminoglycoside phosphotransferase family protein [Larkinella rosea]